MRIFLALMCLVIGRASFAASGDPSDVTVDVSFDPNGIESRVAAMFWADLERDLEARLTDRIAGQSNLSASSIIIDMDEAGMSRSFRSALGAGSKIKGRVDVRNIAEPSANSSYELSVTVEQAGRFAQGHAAMQILSVPVEQIYDTMIDAFAAGIVARLR